VALLDIESELLHGAVAALANPDNTLALHCDVSDAGSVTAATAKLNARFGRPRRAGQQCRHRGVRAAAGDLRRRLEPGTGRQSHRTVSLHQGGCTPDARTWRRRGSEHHVDFGGARLDAALGLRHQQSGAGASHQATRRRTGVARHSRQRRRTRSGRDRDGESRSHPEIRADYHDAIPLNRYGLEEELAEAVFFFVQRPASYITGQISRRRCGFDAAGIGLPTLRGEKKEFVTAR